MALCCIPLGYYPDTKGAAMHLDKTLANADDLHWLAKQKQWPKIIELQMNNRIDRSDPRALQWAHWVTIYSQDWHLAYLLRDTLPADLQDEVGHDLLRMKAYDLGRHPEIRRKGDRDLFIQETDAIIATATRTRDQAARARAYSTRAYLHYAFNDPEKAWTYAWLAFEDIEHVQRRFKWHATISFYFLVLNRDRSAPGRLKALHWSLTGLQMHQKMLALIGFLAPGFARILLSSTARHPL